jgi:hypothetical protein
VNTHHGEDIGELGLYRSKFSENVMAIDAT